MASIPLDPKAVTTAVVSYCLVARVLDEPCICCWDCKIEDRDYLLDVSLYI